MLLLDSLDASTACMQSKALRRPFPMTWCPVDFSPKNNIPIIGIKRRMEALSRRLLACLLLSPAKFCKIYLSDSKSALSSPAYPTRAMVNNVVFMGE